VKPSTFLTHLWGPLDSRLRIQLWALDGKRTTLLQAAASADYFADGKTDMYTSVALCGARSRGGRPLASESLGIAGLWLDTDVDGGPNGRGGVKTGGVPTVADAMDMAAAFETPTVMVCSGYGLHAWYLFQEPWLFFREEDRQAAALASAQWFKLHRQWGAARGWGLDHAHDLARLLRLPGTFNGKGETPTEVYALDHRGPRYERQHLLDLAATAGPVDLTGAAVSPVSDVSIQAGAQLEDAQLDALLSDPDVAAVFHHADGNAERWSLSEYDMSLATTLARAGGWTNDQIAAVLVAHRARHGETSKARRTKYLNLTIAKARGAAQRTDAAQQLSLLGRQAAA
jgi:hypothetical protein